MVYTINWFKKCNILITVLTLSNWPGIVPMWPLISRKETASEYDKINNCPWYAPLPFVTIEGQLLSVRTVINMLHFLNQLIVYTIWKLRNPGNKNRTNLSSEETEKQVPVLSHCPCWPIPESPLPDFLLTNFSHPEYDWNIVCWTLSNLSINQSIRTHYCIQLYWCLDIAF
jgi:hypothetical protein